MSTVANLKNKSVLSWALYDWANSAFATTVIAGFFPIFFKDYWSAGMDVTESTFNLGLGNSIAGLLLALMAPFLGALADSSDSKKKFLFFFMMFGVIATAGMVTADQGDWFLAVLFYVIASLGYTGGNIFYDSLIMDVSRGKDLDVISGIGYAVGYLGGGLLFVLNVLMYLKYEWFGFADGAQAIKYSFVSVAVWWLLFSLPLFFNVKELDQGESLSGATSRALGKLLQTIKDLKNQKVLLLFLLAYFFYIDGVNTMIKMAVDYGMALGFQPTNFITALIIVQFVAFPAALFFGWVGERWGALRGIFITLAIYSAVTIWGYFMTNTMDFYLMATAIGLVQGGVQALSRSHFASMVPQERSAEFFGFFNMFGKFSSFMGPLLVGWVSYASGSPRLSILVILAFFIIGGGILLLHRRHFNIDKA